MSIRVRESQIEDVFVTFPELLAKALNLRHDVRLISRQLRLPSGRLDLLLTAADRLLLVELKTVAFSHEALIQVLRYCDELKAFQSEGLMIQAPIDPYLLVTGISPSDQELCRSHGVSAIIYSPEMVLNAFYSQLSAASPFISMKSSDHGIWSLHLINRLLYALPSTISTLAAHLSLSPRTISNLLRLSQEFRLVERQNELYSLTSLGEAWVSARDADAPDNFVSDRQAAVLRDYIVRDPFATSTIFGVYSVVESVSILAKNAYPVRASHLIPFFKEYVGKRHQWSAEKTAFHGVKMYSNYAVELGLLAEVNNSFYLTPEGLRLVLLLQLHKGIKLVDAMRIHL